MKIIIMIMFVLGALLFCPEIPLGYSQETNMPVYNIKAVDINKDGKPEVTYYYDNKYVNKAEADTNNDGKPDITVYAQNGKFKSAKADTNNDGMPDRNFSNLEEFNKWLNESHPEYKDSLGWQDWSYTVIKF